MLYICATPIGNLKDISIRALEILFKSDIILCEDTRISKRLFLEHNIKYQKLVSFHEHNELEITEKVIKWLTEGLLITQISDAGTPGISDPGARLCNKVLKAGFKISPVPGACAYTSLLSVSGITDPSLFMGFLPSQKTARQKILSKYQFINYAVCIYEAPHRIISCICDIIECLGENREIIMGRELTKQFETIKKLRAEELLKFIKDDPNQQKGEFVLIIYPDVIHKDPESLTDEQIKCLKNLLEELPPKKAVSLTNKILGGDKKLLYNIAISFNKEKY